MAEEVLVVGGGPAGSVLAMLLARWGRRVLLVSDSSHQGGLPAETVVPSAGATLKRLHLTDAIGHCASIGPQEHGRCWQTPRFTVEELQESERGWRFLRPQLDLWLRQEARRSGVQVMEGARVSGVLPEDGCGEVLVVSDGQTIAFEAALVIAATGRSSGAPFLPVEVSERSPEMIALNAIVESPAELEDRSVIEAVAEGWIWWLPLGDGRVSLALFCDPLEVRKKGRLEVWRSALGAALGPARGCPSGVRRGTLATARVHRSRKGLLLAGDAISAIDPLSSQGLEKAIVSAEATALAANTVLLGAATIEEMVDSRNRWETRLFRLHQRRALDLYDSERRFEECPFWLARHGVERTVPRDRRGPLGFFSRSPDLIEDSRWIPSGDRLVARGGVRPQSSDEEAVDRIGAISVPVLLEVVGDGGTIEDLQRRAARQPGLVALTPELLARALREMCRLDLLVES